MLKEKKKWVAPQVLDLGALPEGLGHCVGGSTEVDTGPGQGCFNGQKTSGLGPGHACGMGGIAS